jgi:hypothetical protein
LRRHLISLDFHRISARFRVLAPSAAPSRHDKIRIRSTHGMACDLACASAAMPAFRIDWRTALAPR